MTTYDLSQNQMIQLKGDYLCDIMNERGEQPTWGELAFADQLVDDEVIHDYYAGTIFSDDDFV